MSNSYVSVNFWLVETGPSMRIVCSVSHAQYVELVEHSRTKRI